MRLLLRQLFVITTAVVVSGCAPLPITPIAPTIKPLSFIELISEGDGLPGYSKTLYGFQIDNKVRVEGSRIAFKTIYDNTNLLTRLINKHSPDQEFVDNFPVFVTVQGWQDCKSSEAKVVITKLKKDRKTVVGKPITSTDLTQGLCEIFILQKKGVP